MRDYKNLTLLKVTLFCILSMSVSTITIAQNLIGPTSVSPSSIETYTYNDGISYLHDGWNITNGTIVSNSESGTIYTVIVQWNSNLGAGSIAFKKKQVVLETLAVTVETIAPPTVVTELNYVHNITPKIATTDIITLGNSDKIEAITYFDGLGRTAQQVAIRAGGNREDIITHVGYDEFGRVTKDYLPYTSTSNIGTYRTDALAATLNYYNASAYNDDFPGMTIAEINPYSEKEFDNSPLSRVLKQAAPGKDWKMGNGHEIEMEYLTNTSATEVQLYKVLLTKSTYNNSIITYNTTLELNGYYPVNELYKTITRDENHDGSTTKNHTTEEFTDKQGRVILKRTYNNSEPHDTYYVYDDYGNLSYVLPPKAEPQTAKPDTTELNELCYRYKYDHLNRLVEKKIPGKGWEYIVYDKLDRPIMTQDTNLKNLGKWLVTKYDVFGRVVYTAIKNATATRVVFQHSANTNSTATQYENKVASGTGYLGTYYTNNSIPKFVDDILTINYYDNYIFDLAGGFAMPSYNVLSIASPKGLATGSKVRILGTDDWITTVSYYDDKSRPIYVYSHNAYLNTTDQVKSQFLFDGTVSETTTTHYKVGENTITTIDRLEYDHTNRLIKHKQKVNNAALDEIIVSNVYDDLGQLKRKGVGGKQNVSSRLQNVDFEYNIRGWLKKINNPSVIGNDLFAFALKYNDSNIGDALFNGNISQTFWKTKNLDQSTKAYTYSYDDLNRLTNAIDYTGKFNTQNISYDKNGNILTLIRKGHIVNSPMLSNNSDFGNMDNLDYTYEAKSNKLKKVLDNGNDNHGFMDGANAATEYFYDSNGNMVVDINKGIANITYNHLNLPEQVFLSGGNIQYIYDATGIKQKKIVSTGTTTEYAGNYIYQDGNLKMFSHSEGYAEPGIMLSKGGILNFDYVYQYKDHLGNIRLSYADSDGNGSIDASTEIISESNYYPLGMTHSGYNNIVSANANSQAEKYKYNGKELEESLGYDMYEYEARHYDASLGRFVTIDPLAEDYSFQTTYSYAINNPVRFIDKLGMGPEDLKFRFENKSAREETQANLDAGLGKGIATIGTDGLVTLNATEEQISNFTDEQKAFYNTLNEAVSNEATTTIKVVNDHEFFRFASMSEKTIDIGDINALGQGEGSNQNSVLAHEVKEQFERQVNDTSKQDSHEAGIQVENSMSGYERQQSQEPSFIENATGKRRMTRRAAFGRGSVSFFTLSGNGQFVHKKGNTVLKVNYTMKDGNVVPGSVNRKKNKP